jgi:hypothetical protein
MRDAKSRVYFEQMKGRGTRGHIAYRSQRKRMEKWDPDLLIVSIPARRLVNDNILKAMDFSTAAKGSEAFELMTEKMRSRKMRSRKMRSRKYRASELSPNDSNRPSNLRVERLGNKESYRMF